jgi:hypothetical protein
MNQAIEGLMYAASQLFLIPVLLAIGVLFLHAFHALGAFLWQARQRRVGLAAGFELIEARRQDPACGLLTWRRSRWPAWSSPALQPGWHPCLAWLPP